ncbi:hypothetical protein BKA83DRAFT_4129929 [Pisolithus microcarpus]|nr:hypothetical protein BKA83DRAFT_4129929 [Pisolithus microcarpus]
MDSNSASATGLILNLSGVHVLYATEHAFVTALWASTAVPISESAPASILLLAPQEIGDSPWFLIKSPFVHLGRSLRPNPDERARGAHPLGWDDDVAMYWCFKYMTSCVAYRVRPSKYAYDEATLLDDFLQCKIPGQVPAGMPAPGSHCDPEKERKKIDTSLDELHSSVVRGPLPSGTSAVLLCHSLIMQTEKPAHLSGNVVGDEGAFSLPRTPGRPTVNQEGCQPPACSQHPGNPSISPTTLSPVKQEEILPSMLSTSVKEEQSLSYLGVLIPLVGLTRAHSSTGPLTQKLKNHLTDPMTGKIIEMQTFAEAYNRMLGALRRVVQIAKRGLES